ncbi:MAG: hypothetical protein LBP63_10660 [Prevotellaceae bacterium]|jgi:hypothetical protein|nr:hypothetical protein [Prevotellaceae bacterium]
MTNNEKTSVMVELYDLTLTDRKDDRFGRVVTAGDYKLSITTQYSQGMHNLIEPRTFLFDYVLNV